jgi:hypothetical protein
MRTVLLLLLLASGMGRTFADDDLRAALERRVAVELDAARRTARAEEHQRRGRELARTGQEREASEEFRRAEAVILDADEDTYFQTSLRAYLHELRSRATPGMGGLSPADAEGLAMGPEPTVDARTRTWLRASLARPVPEEKELRTIFRSRQVPEELIYIGLVESGYGEHAVSPAGAAGPWQFMPETARRYGLRRDWQVDERHDLLKSARAAAAYLRDLYELLGDWTLAIAAYNAGEYRVLRAMQKSGSRDFAGLKQLLPPETIQYVPRVLTAIRMARGTEQEIS